MAAVLKSGVTTKKKKIILVINIAFIFYIKYILGRRHIYIFSEIFSKCH